MKMKSVIFGSVAVFLLAFAVPRLSATQMTYQMGGGCVTAQNGPSGLSYDPNVSLGGPTSFSLNDGESFTFDFFTIWTNGGGVGNDLQIQTQQIQLFAVLNLSGGALGGQNLGGSMYNGSAGGAISWNGPLLVDLGDRVFEISLSNANLQSGTYGPTGTGYGATIQATITQISSNAPVAVPDNGNTAIFLGLSLVAVALGGRFWAGRKPGLR